jgi:hypothetical protein
MTRVIHLLLLAWIATYLCVAAVTNSGIYTERAVFLVWLIITFMVLLTAVLMYYAGRHAKSPDAASWGGLKQGKYRCLGYVSYVAEENISLFRIVAGKCLPARQLYICSVKGLAGPDKGKILTVEHHAPLPDEFVWNQKEGEVII